MTSLNDLPNGTFRNRSTYGRDIYAMYSDLSQVYTDTPFFYQQLWDTPGNLMTDPVDLGLCAGFTQARASDAAEVKKYDEAFGLLSSTVMQPPSAGGVMSVTAMGPSDGARYCGSATGSDGAVVVWRADGVPNTIIPVARWMDYESLINAAAQMPKVAATYYDGKFYAFCVYPPEGAYIAAGGGSDEMVHIGDWEQAIILHTFDQYGNYEGETDLTASVPDLYINLENGDSENHTDRSVLAASGPLGLSVGGLDKDTTGHFWDWNLAYSYGKFVCCQLKDRVQYVDDYTDSYDAYTVPRSGWLEVVYTTDEDDVETFTFEANAELSTYMSEKYYGGAIGVRRDAITWFSTYLYNVWVDVTRMNILIDFLPDFMAFTSNGIINLSDFGNTTLSERVDIYTPGITVSEPDRFPSFGATSVQTMTVSGFPTGGTFRLRMRGVQTPDLPHDVRADALQIALEGMSVIGAGNVIVTGASWQPKTITFPIDMPMLNLSENSLTGGDAPTVAVTVPSSIPPYAVTVRTDIAYPYTEVMLVTGKEDNNLVVERGYGGTTARNHYPESTVALNYGEENIDRENFLALAGAQFCPEHIVQLRNLIELIAKTKLLKHPDEDKPYSWTYADPHNLYRKATLEYPLTRYADWFNSNPQYSWQRSLAEMVGTKPYDVDPGEVFACIELLKAAESVFT